MQDQDPKNAAKLCASADASAILLKTLKCFQWLWLSSHNGQEPFSSEINDKLPACCSEDLSVFC